MPEFSPEYIEFVSKTIQDLWKLGAGDRVTTRVPTGKVFLVVPSRAVIGSTPCYWQVIDETGEPDCGPLLASTLQQTYRWLPTLDDLLEGLRKHGIMWVFNSALFDSQNDQEPIGDYAIRDRYDVPENWSCGSTSRLAAARLLERVLEESDETR